MTQSVHCSFCGKLQHEVALLVAGPNVFACNECVELFVDILKERGIPPFGQPKPPHQLEGTNHKDHA